MGGGNLCYGVTKSIMPYVEYGYFPSVHHETVGSFAGTGNNFTFAFNLPLSDFEGGVHVRIPIRESRVVPYFVAGIGALTNPDTHATAFFPTFGTVQSVVIPVPGNTAFAANFGGGLRFYTSQHFGFRVEAKVYKPVGGSSSNVNQLQSNVFGKVEAGFFYQFR
jgi:hypothetical protein